MPTTRLPLVLIVSSYKANERAQATGEHGRAQESIEEQRGARWSREGAPGSKGPNGR
jgi:hypothetical protein